MSAILAQASSGTTEIEILAIAPTQVPRAGLAIIEKIIVCNRGGNPATFRISMTLDGGPTEDKDYLYYDSPLKGNETVQVIIGATFSDRATLRGSASKGLISFTVIGLFV